MTTLFRKISSWLLTAILLTGGGFMGASAQTRGNHRSSNNTSQARPGTNFSSSRDKSGNHRATTTARPSGDRKGGNHGYRPGNNGNENRPGGNHGYRPGNNGNENRPGGNHGYRPGGSAPRPGSGGAYRPNRPPRPHYYPPRPTWGRPVDHFGYWRPLPPPPPRPTYYYTTGYIAPTIPAILGLTFGSLIDYGLQTLINAGYTIAGYQNDAIFLNNVNIYGLRWPQATVYYGSSGMNGALFQYRSYSLKANPYNKVYRQLKRKFGNPVEEYTGGSSQSATWWGGNESGYITLSTSPEIDDSGNEVYETNLTYGN